MWMLRRISKTASVKAHPDEAIKLLTSKLPATYQAIIQPLISRQAELFGIPRSAFKGRDVATYARAAFAGDDEAVDAEVYAFGSILIVVTIMESVRLVNRRNSEDEMVTTEEKSSMLRVTYGVPFVEDPDVVEFEKFVTEVWPGIKLKESTSTSRRLREIANGKPNTTKAPTEEELGAASVLSDKAVRMLAIAIKSSSGLLLGDASKQIPPKERGRVDFIVQLLIDKGLVETEVVVICTKTAAQVSRVPTSEVLKDLDKHGLRCACGKSLSAEKQEKALRVTEFGRSMIDGSAWLSFLVLQYLIDFGVPVSQVRMEQEYAGEEVDCLAEIYGRIVLFELKDKEFNLGNAYSFGAKVGIFRPDIPVIVTTERVGADARDHFVRSATVGRGARRYAFDESSSGEKMTFIEGLDNLREGIESVVTEIASASLAPALRTALSFSSASPASLLSAWSGIDRPPVGDASSP